MNCCHNKESFHAYVVDIYHIIHLMIICTAIHKSACAVTKITQEFIKSLRSLFSWPRSSITLTISLP